MRKPIASPVRFLVPQFNKIGDTLIMTPLLEGLKSLSTDACVAVLASPEAVPVLENNPHVDVLETTPIRPGANIGCFAKYVQICRRMVREHGIESLVLDAVNSNPASALLAPLLGVSTRVMANPLKPRYRVLESLFSTPNGGLPLYGNALEYNLATLRSMGIDTAALRVSIYPSREEMDTAAEALRTLRLAPTRKTVTVAPFTSKDATMWPREYLECFLSSVADLHNTIVVGTAADLRANTWIRPLAVKCVSHLNLREAYALVKQTDALVAMDSAPAHFVQALDIPVLRVNASHMPLERWDYPRAQNHFRFVAPQTCSPCYASVCKREGHPCLSDIAPAAVLDRLNQVLGGRCQS